MVNKTKNYALIRKAVESDANEISHLVANLSHFYLNDEQADLPEWFANTLDIKEFKHRLSNDYFTHLVAVLNNQIAGYIAMRGENHLYHLFVAEQHQGKGIARDLWQHMVSISPSDSYTLRSSIHAIPVYQQFGFIKDGESGERDGICYQEMLFKT